VSSGPALVRAQVGCARVWCSGRAVGNVGDHVGDDPSAVVRHRRALAQAAGLAEPNTWVWMRQVHGRDVFDADAPTPETDPPVADAAVTTRAGLPLAVVTADCAPVVVANDDAVAVVHAGHRGLANGVIEAAVARVRADGAGDVHAFLGPCIRPARYEFGDDDLRVLVDRLGAGVRATTRAGRPALDIPEAVRVVLDRVGVDLSDCGICTADDASYFSYRRDGQTGRQATVAVKA
jgi:purine-nucleoside/S-methyl-5'-thioadenosine phosphorylase / adenosine deaminase